MLLSHVNAPTRALQQPAGRSEILQMRVGQYYVVKSTLHTPPSPIKVFMNTACTSSNFWRGKKKAIHGKVSISELSPFLLLSSCTRFEFAKCADYFATHRFAYRVKHVCPRIARNSGCSEKIPAQNIVFSRLSAKFLFLASQIRTC